MRCGNYAVSVMLLLMCVGSGQASSHQIPFNLQHFFYHDERNIIEQMQLAPKVGMRFMHDISEDEQNAFLAMFAFTSKTKDPKDTSRLFLEFAPRTSPHDMQKILNEIASSDIAEATPVFLINNVEAIVEGIVIQPKTILFAVEIAGRIKRFGEFILGVPTLQQDEWIFPVTAVKPPLNLFILINLVHEDDWVKRAYPLFRYLHDPIVSSMAITPVSGTIGEPRVLRWTIHIFDPRIAVDERLLPEFGKGTFLPTFDNKSAPSYLFTLVSEREKSEGAQHRGTEFTYAWTFRQYGIGEWTIVPQPLPYAIDGNQHKIDTRPATFVVTSLVGQLKIDDMPAPGILQVPFVNLPAGINARLLPDLPVYWFDQWIADTRPVVWHATRIMFACLGAMLLLLFSQMTVSVKRRCKCAAAKKAFRSRIDAFCEEARIQRSYAPLYEGVCTIFTKAFPDLPKHPLHKDIEESAMIKSMLTGRIRQVLDALFLGFSNMYMKDFAVQEGDVERLSSYLHEVHAFFEPIMNFREEGGA